MRVLVLVSTLVGCSFELAPRVAETPIDGASDGIPPVDGIDAASCPADFVTVTGAPATSRYKIYGWSATSADNRVSTWDAAVATCAAQQSHLVIVDDLAELNALAAVIARNPVSNTQDLYWDGISDTAVELQWTTVLGTVPSFATWGPGEGPNKGGPDLAQNCAAVYVPGQCVNDAACGVSYFFPFACECEP